MVHHQSEMESVLLEFLVLVFMALLQLKDIVDKFEYQDTSLQQGSSNSEDRRVLKNHHFWCLQSII